MGWLSRYKVFRFVILFILLDVVKFGRAQLDQACRHPLGMEDKRIPDSSLTATSSHASSTGPRYARLGRDEGGGAWCPATLIEPGEEEEYITIQLPTASFVARIATQGRFGGGSGAEFTKSYKLNYSRDGRHYFSWTSNTGVTMLQGNTGNVNKAEARSLYPGIAGAKYIRVIPVSRVSTVACLRLELYGCSWNSGLVSYIIPTPDDYSPDPVSFPFSMYSDDTYDGVTSSSSFTRGLGQLSDGVIGYDDISRTKSRYQTTSLGYDYVGWSSREGTRRKVVMRFQFDEARNFTSLKLHCSLSSQAGASLFSSLTITSSLDGRTFTEASQSSRLAFNGHMNLDGAPSRLINVPLHHLVARAIELIFELGPGRLLLSEVEFLNSRLPPDMLERVTAGYKWVEEVGDAVGDTHVTQTPTPSENDVNVGLIVGILVGVIVLLAIIVIALYCRQRKLRKTMVPPAYSYRPGSSRGDHVVTLAPRLSSPDSSGDPTDRKLPIPIYHEIGPTALPPDNLYLEPSDAVRRAPPPPYQAVQTGNGVDNKNTKGCDVTVELPPSEGSSAYGESSSAPHYAETDAFLPKLEAQPLQGVSGTNIYAVPWSTPSPRRARRKNKAKKARTLPELHGSSKDTGASLLKERNALLSTLDLASCDLPPEYPRDRLEFIEKLGEGQFGEVHLCRADSSIRDLDDDDDFVLPDQSDGKVLVAVKILRKGASTNAKEDFMKEVRVMSRLQDPNIVALLAVCTRDEPFAMVTEYMEHGDLNQYLQTFDDDIKPSPGKTMIGNESIIKMAAQIASGMDYLSSLNFVHRDLATRNCLIGTDYSIRIGDFGMSRNMYQSDYYRIQGRAVLPIRWMSWECVLMGKFSSASDVWSFGVTLWEMFSLCKYQPYARLSEQQVIENMHHIFRRTSEEVYLPRPKRCPASMFNMIRQCWKRNPQERPTFQQLHCYLLERQQTAKSSPKPKKPVIKPPVPATRTKLSQ